jgi:hypothetical protein
MCTTDTPADRPTERNRLFISRETRYGASQFGLQAFPVGAIHHMTMRPRVQGNWEQETGSYMSLHSVDYTSKQSPSHLPTSLLQALLVFYLLAVWESG